MGWFLRDKSKKAARGKAGKTLAGVSRQQRWRQAGLVALAVAAVVIGLLLLRAGERRLHDWAEQTFPMPVTPESVVIAELPTWMSPATQMEVQRLVASVLDEAGPFDQTALFKAAQALEAFPWVEQVVQVHRNPRGEVVVEARFREPVVIVQGRDGYHLLDRQAVVLPGLYMRHHVEHLPLLILTGVRSAPPGQAGGRWVGSDIQAGLDMVGLLQGEPYTAQITAIDLSQVDDQGRQRVRLQTPRGQVRWGFAPNVRQAVEPLAQDKLMRLRQMHEQHDGGIDAGGQVVEIFGPRIMILDQR